MKGCSRRLSTVPRTVRAMRGTSTTEMARITFCTEPPATAISAMASSTPGMAISPSMQRISTLSSRREEAAAMPMTVPMIPEITATAMPTISDTRAP